MSEALGKILVVDHDAAMRQSIRTTLGGLGFLVDEAASGENALKLAKSKQFDAVLLDVNMPGMSGMQACRELRSLFPRLSILMVTVSGSRDDMVDALESGADDCVATPFYTRELAARLKAVVRRNKRTDAGPGAFSVGDIELCPYSRVVKKTGREVHLTPREFDLLQYFMTNAGVLIPHARLLRAVWGAEYGNELEYLRTYVRQLRLKIETNPSRPVYLLTHSHVGYRFCRSSPDDADRRNWLRSGD